MSNKIQAAGFLLFARSPKPQVLLMRHRDRWDLPKGHVEEGESLLQAALRETEEETGIHAELIVADPDFRFAMEYSVNTEKRGLYDKQVTFFLGYLDQAISVTLTEHTGYCWRTWPIEGSIQSQTIDPLINALRRHFEIYPERLA